MCNSHGHPDDEYNDSGDDEECAHVICNATYSHGTHLDTDDDDDDDGGDDDDDDGGGGDDEECASVMCNARCKWNTLSCLCAMMAS